MGIYYYYYYYYYYFFFVDNLKIIYRLTYIYPHCAELQSKIPKFQLIFIEKERFHCFFIFTYFYVVV